MGILLNENASPLPVANIPDWLDSEHLPGQRPLPKSVPGKGHAPSSSNKLAGLQPQSHGKDSNWHSHRIFLSFEMVISERLRVVGRHTGAQPGQPVLLGGDRNHHPGPEEAGQTTYLVAS